MKEVERKERLEALTRFEREVNTILFEQWDPIGCGIPEDEYVSYVKPLIAAIRTHRFDTTEASIAAAVYLTFVECVTMGIPPRAGRVDERMIGAIRSVVRRVREEDA